tara:strand:- start:431 stop:865 length:435 start_codon:yes stop_codon:yes gene_type:complete
MFIGLTVVSILVLSSCGLVQQSTQRPSISAEDTRLIIDALIEDLPLPPNSEIRNRESVILGSGHGWGGRIGIDDPLSPAETLLFFREAVPASGWNLSSSTVGQSIIMVFEKPDRIATVEIFKGSRFGPETDVTISVVPRMLMGN